jgi:hypothetical protein
VVGLSEGLLVTGFFEGETDGFGVTGEMDGETDGVDVVGDSDGDIEGCEVVGESVIGALDGLVVGFTLGSSDGFEVGSVLFTAKAQASSSPYHSHKAAYRARSQVFALTPSTLPNMIHSE